MSGERVRAAQDGHTVDLCGGGLHDGTWTIPFIRPDDARRFVEQVSAVPLPDGVYCSPVDGWLYALNYLYAEHPPEGYRWRADAGSVARAVELVSEAVRPGGWVEGIGWVARAKDLDPGTLYSYDPCNDLAHDVLAVVSNWADGTVPAPASGSDGNGAGE